MLSPIPFKTPQNMESCVLLPNQAGFRICHSDLPSFTKAEVCCSAFPQSQFISKHPSQLLAWLGESPHSSISSVTVFSRQASPPASCFLFQTSWHAPLHTRPCGGPLLFQPTLLLKAQPWPSCVTSYPVPPICVTVCHFCQFPISFTVFWLPVLVRARVPREASASPGCVMSCTLLKSHTPFTLGGSPLPFRKGMPVNLPLLCKVP